ncbi:hypothetical protein ACFPRL_29770 [Pseudoclavibacter helvolus]
MREELVEGLAHLADLGARVDVVEFHCLAQAYLAGGERHLRHVLGGGHNARERTHRDAHDQRDEQHDEADPKRGQNKCEDGLVEGRIPGGVERDSRDEGVAGVTLPLVDHDAEVAGDVVELDRLEE